MIAAFEESPASVERWMVRRLRGVDGATRFHVLARDPVVGASVAMFLRDALPGATVLSIPNPGGPADPDNAHILACAAWMPGRSEQQTRHAVEDAFASLDTAGGDRGPLLVFDPESEALLAA